MSVRTAVIQAIAASALMLMSSTATRAEGPGFCFIDLLQNTIDNHSPGAISAVFGPAAGKVVIKVTLNKAVTGYSRARFHVHYATSPSGITVNIGDSATNDGGGGDAGTQSNDAEMQMSSDTLSVYGKDATPVAVKNILTVKNAVTAGQTIAFEVRNNAFGWDGHTLVSDNLYALGSQIDTEGPVNFDVYAAFNRVISLSSPRVGTGVGWVMIQLLP